MVEENPNIDPKNAQEAAKATSEMTENIKAFSKEATDAGMSLGSIANHLKNIAKGSKEFKTEIQGAGQLVSSVSKMSEDIAQFTKDGLASQKDTEKFLKKQKIVKGQIQAIESKMAVLIEKAANAGEEEAEQIMKSVEALAGAQYNAERLLDTFEAIEEVNDELNNETKFFDSMSDLVGEIPIVGKLFGEFKSGAEAARKAGVEGGDALFAGAAQLAGAAGKMGMLFAAGTFMKGIFKTNQDVTDLSRNLNLSREEARGLDSRFRTLSANTKGLTSEAFRVATSGVSEELGIAADLSNETLVTMGAMTKKFGLSSQEAAKLASITAATGQDIKGFNDDLIGRVQLQNVVNGTTIRYQDVMKDIADASAAVQLSTANMPGGLAQAAFQARRLGLSFSTMESIAGNLLQIEDSIGAEMEAELLIGRNLNLDGARRAALSNNLVEMSEQLAANGITAAKFGDMNRIQQEAVAKAMGMSREEMADMFIKQEAIKKLGGDQSKSLSENVRARFAEVQAMEEGVAKEKAMAELRATAGAEETIRQLENKSVQEAQLEAMQKMVEAVGGLSVMLEPITAFFNVISNAAGETLGFITKMSSKLKTVGNLIKMSFKPLVELPKKGLNFLKKISGFFKTLGTGAAKTAGKSLLKKIPIIGLIVGVGLAIKRAMSGDILGALGEIGSGVASLFPGIGTGISMGIDAALMGSDAAGLTGLDGGSLSVGGGNVEVDDFTLSTNPRDTLVMAGGTRLGGNVESLLEQLIETVRASSGQDIMIDGFKVAEVMQLSDTSIKNG
tara:strand:- start:7665 stop:10025 length:2361 start_codon:yes stop_codon:yes gene_type:complete